MSTEMETLVHAIESLQQEANPFKDYIFPIVAAFFTSLLGAGVAFFTLKYQEKTQIEKDKMDAVNKWTLIAEEAQSSLIALKNNYVGRLTDDPIHRVLQVPSIVHNTVEINEDVVNLAFLIPSLTDIVGQDIKWRKLTLIRAMIKNYNFLIGLWNKRNDFERPLRLKLKADYPHLNTTGISMADIVDSIGEIALHELIDLTERCIIYTDDILVELNDFLINFPVQAKPLIKTDKLKHYGKIITFSENQAPAFLRAIEKVPEVNYDSLAAIYGEDAERLRQEYSTGYCEQ